ncbi:NAD(P)-binding protein [Plenodomus tracheiphilus IPT5]|uniref:NAD(P)-binding protein n=1 Tax=Plenodomus tracheiphilus IPT5 TaxID=1408161 RepID=A0A6A7AXX5_9PLEO|nr:NAD(P)-binding protein [Plenodomus tracheiphilus IPT5]
MPSKIIAVAGGSGNIGRTIIEELLAYGGYEIFVLGREVSNGLSKELGAPILAVDYSDHSSLVSILQSNSIDTIISTMSSKAEADPELSLIKAADGSIVTKRYIPSIWSIRYTDEVAKYYPRTHVKHSTLRALAFSNLEYTSILNGFFLDYYGTPNIETHLPPFPFILDIANNTAAIPASGNVPIIFTYSFDVARFVARLLREPVWEKESIIVGDQLTWTQFLALAEEVRGTKFKVGYDGVEMLRRGRITELPGHRALYGVVPKETLQGISAVFALMMEEGLVRLEREGSLNEKFKDIEVMTARELVERAWRGR